MDAQSLPPGAAVAGDPFGRDRLRRAVALRLVMWFFLAALGMFFAGCVVGYVIIRTIGPQSPAFGVVRLPWGLAASACLLLAASWFLHGAVGAVRRERQDAFRRNLSIVAGLAAVFLVVQTIALSQLLAAHFVHREATVVQAAELGSWGEVLPRYGKPDGRLHLYGLIWMLVFVHAVHVVGGLIPLGIVTRKAYAGAYDHESHDGVLLLARYWHFLDGVWLVMLAMFALLG